MAPSLLKKLFDKTSQHTDYEKLPPSSLSSRSSETIVTAGLDTDTYEKPSSAEGKSRNKNDIKTSCVQICPHETLPFKRMKRIVHLPNFKFSRDMVSAFTHIPGHVSPAAGIVLCKPHPNGFKSLRADSFYRYQRGCAGSYDGLILCVCWMMSFDDHLSIAGSVSDLQSFLDKLDIYLCPHINISDLRIAARLHRLCNPSCPTQDPIEAYEEEYRSRTIEGCKDCHTTFKTYKEGNSCHILVKRYLGKGNSAYEKRWLAQCGGQKHRLRSLGVAALQSLKI